MIRGTIISSDTLRLLNFPSGFSHNSKFAPIKFEIRLLLGGPQGDSVWTDGNDIYCGSGSSQFILNRTTQSWEDKIQSGISDVSFFGSMVWTDGTNIYHTNGGTIHILKDGVWKEKTWDISSVGQYPSNSAVWLDGETAYYSSGSYQYVLNKDTDTWEPKTWNGLTSFGGTGVWSDGTDIYYSYSDSDNIIHNYVLNRETDTWEEKTLNNVPASSSLWKKYSWTDGTNVYYSSGSTQRVFNKETSAWETQVWNVTSNFYGTEMWSDGSCIYYSAQSFNDSELQGDYILLPSTAKLYSRVGGKWAEFGAIS